MAARMQQRRGTASQWTSVNPVLGSGEIGFETDTSRFKMGNGTSTWSALPYFSDAELIIDGAPAALNTLNKIAAALGDDPNAITTIQSDISDLQSDKADVTYVDQAISNVVGTDPGVLDTIVEIADAINNDVDFFNSITQTAQSFADQAEANAIAAAESHTDAQVLAVADDLAETVINLSNLSGDLNSLSDNLDSLSDIVDGHTSELSGIQSAITDQTAGLETANDAILLKAPINNPTFTGTVGLPATTSIGNVTSSEIGYLEGVTSPIQTQIDTKLDSGVASGIYAPLNDPTFGGTVSLPSTTSIGDVSSTEIGYVNGVSSSIQTQIDAKAPSADPTFTGTVSGITKTHVGLGNVDNTSDADKPVSTATQTALDAKASLAGANFTGNVEVDGNMVVDGNLTVNGTEFIASATSITIEDNLIQIAHTNPANTVDLGVVVAYNDGTAQHAGIVRDVSDNTWKLFKGVETEPATTVAFGEGSLDDLELNNIKTAGVVFTDGTQTRAGVPSLTTFVEKTASYTLDTLSHQDGIIEMNSSSPTTFTIPTNAALAWPIGASMDIFQTGTGEVTIVGDTGVTVNRTPGNKLRTQWSSATILKRGTDNWILYGDLKA